MTADTQGVELGVPDFCTRVPIEEFVHAGADRAADAVQGGERAS
jgi:hypothetical protein